MKMRHQWIKTLIGSNYTIMKRLMMKVILITDERSEWAFTIIQSSNLRVSNGNSNTEFIKYSCDRTIFLYLKLGKGEKYTENIKKVYYYTTSIVLIYTFSYIILILRSKKTISLKMLHQMFPLRYQRYVQKIYNSMTKDVIETVRLLLKIRLIYHLVTFLWTLNESQQIRVC